MRSTSSHASSAAPEMNEAPAYPLYPPRDVYEYIPAAWWRLFGTALRCARTRGIRAAIGGGVAVSLYTGMWRSPHDLDLLITPQHRDAMVSALTEAGFGDYYGQEPYDRSWIYRATRDGIVLDAIWGFANGVADVDEAWVDRGAEATLGHLTVSIVPPEELIWSKLYVVQGGRCDWPEILNLLYAAGAVLDWERLIARCGDDRGLLGSVVALFAWLAPGRAHAFPEEIWPRLHLARPVQREPLIDRSRIDRLDSRPWFSPVLLEDVETVHRAWAACGARGAGN